MTLKYNSIISSMGHSRNFFYSTKTGNTSYAYIGTTGEQYIDPRITNSDVANTDENETLFEGYDGMIDQFYLLANASSLSYTLTVTIDDFEASHSFSGTTSGYCYYYLLPRMFSANEVHTTPRYFHHIIIKLQITSGTGSMTPVFRVKCEKFISAW